VTDPTDRPDPAWDPALRQTVTSAVNDLLMVAADVLRRYTDHLGQYAPPDPVPDGDVSGLIEEARVQVVERLWVQAERTLAVMRDAYGQIDADRRARYGDSYRPVRRAIDDTA